MKPLQTRLTTLAGLAVIGFTAMTVSYRAAHSAALLVAPSASRRGSARAGQSAVVVELFTSEGCSSCPPADRLLARLDQTQPVQGAQIIALEQHVDYWNGLGWMDPFSSAQFTERQTDYVRALGDASPYTPQMVVDGAADFVGSDEHTALLAIEKASRAPKASIIVERLADGAPSSSPSAPLRVHLEPISNWNAGDSADVVFAVTENNLSSNVTRGENSGSRLTHRAVVREIRVLGQVGPGGAFDARPNLKLAKNWKAENTRVVVFLQARASRHILGAAEIPLGAPAN
jgi:hypothetical protein